MTRCDMCGLTWSPAGDPGCPECKRRDLQTLLLALVIQIEMSGAKDDHGHELVHLQAMGDAQLLLGRPRADCIQWVPVRSQESL